MRVLHNYDKCFYFFRNDIFSSATLLHLARAFEPHALFRSELLAIMSAAAGLRESVY